MSDIVTIRDADEATFAERVLEPSHQRPVVVDFWAAWCGPCRQLSPLLERVAARHAGEVDVVKIDVDANQGLARTYGVQGIPAVKAFKDGAVVSEFTGLQPEGVLDRFFSSLVPSPADRLVQRAEAVTGEQHEALLRKALDAQADHPRAIVLLAETLAERGETEAAVDLLSRVPADEDARRLRARLHLSAGAAALGDVATLRTRAEHGDAQAQLDLGRALAAADQPEAALEHLLAAVREPVTRDRARTAMLELFEVLGPSDERVKAWRPRLASALY